MWSVEQTHSTPGAGESRSLKESQGCEIVRDWTGLSHKLANEAAGIDKDGSLTMDL